MKRLIFALGIFFVCSCTKTETTTTPPVAIVQEESIKFTTNLDTGTYNVADTLSLSISVSSKLPSAGLIYSITATWTDSSRQIFKLDTTLSQSTLSLYIPGFKKTGNYSLSLVVTSKTTTSNTLTKSISIVNNPLGRFTGYKVASNAYQQGESYWLRGTPILTDFFIYAFQPPYTGTNHIYQAIAGSLGDFNKDGYLDIFNPGFAFQGPVVGFSFLTWNPTSKIFESKNLFNDKSFTQFGGNINKSVPIDLNKDGYMDYVIFDNGDEGIKNPPDEPIRIVLSDGKGGYDLKAIETSEKETYIRSSGETSLIGMHKESGDVGDLNGDGIPDLLIMCNVVTYIYWGIPQFPYFTKNNRAIMLADNQSYGNIGNNGFGENCSRCANYAFNCTIADMNKDGQNDIILGSTEDPSNNIFPTHQRILINKGNGRFNDGGIILLPDYKPTMNYTNGSKPQDQDFVVDDLNGDGLNDIIAMNSLGTSSWDIIVYLQQPDGSYVINYDFVKSNGIPKTGWKPRLMYADYNGDGKKDLGYVDMNFGMIQYNNSILPQKTVYIRNGNQFIEQDFFQFDPYAKSVLPILK